MECLKILGEFGAYDPRQHTPAFVSTIPFYPHDRQTEALELAILQEYKKLRLFKTLIFFYHKILLQIS